MAKLEVGVQAPEFSLPSSEGGMFDLKDCRGFWTVLYFYPKDNTPGCTREACNFRDRIADYKSVDAKILGISMDSLESHNRFIEKFSLPFPLLADADKKVVELYGVLKNKPMFGKSFLGVVRTTFVIDPDGRIARIWRNVRVDGHHEEVLEFIQEQAGVKA